MVQRNGPTENVPQGNKPRKRTLGAIAGIAGAIGTAALLTSGTERDANSTNTESVSSVSSVSSQENHSRLEGFVQNLSVSFSPSPLPNRRTVRIDFTPEQAAEFSGARVTVVADGLDVLTSNVGVGSLMGQVFESTSQIQILVEHKGESESITIPAHQ